MSFGRVVARGWRFDRIAITGDRSGHEMFEREVVVALDGQEAL